jgi:hypothetical protein
LVKEIWFKYDTKKSGSLEAEAIRTLIEEVMKLDGEEHDAPTIEEATRFISFLDIDGDGKISFIRGWKEYSTNFPVSSFASSTPFLCSLSGCIDESEFLKFICNALSMTEDLRMQFAQRSAMHAKVNFKFYF